MKIIDEHLNIFPPQKLLKDSSRFLKSLFVNKSNTLNTIVNPPHIQNNNFSRSTISRKKIVNPEYFSPSCSSTKRLAKKIYRSTHIHAILSTSNTIVSSLFVFESRKATISHGDECPFPSRKGTWNFETRNSFKHVDRASI